MKYNLLGLQGPEGQSNPDAPEAGPYIYDTPPDRDWIFVINTSTTFRY